MIRGNKLKKEIISVNYNLLENHILVFQNFPGIKKILKNVVFDFNNKIKNDKNYQTNDLNWEIQVKWLRGSFLKKVIANNFVKSSKLENVNLKAKLNDSDLCNINNLLSGPIIVVSSYLKSDLNLRSVSNIANSDQFLNSVENQTENNGQFLKTNQGIKLIRDFLRYLNLKFKNSDSSDSDVFFKINFNLPKKNLMPLASIVTFNQQNDSTGDFYQCRCLSLKELNDLCDVEDSLMVLMSGVGNLLLVLENLIESKK